MNPGHVEVLVRLRVDQANEALSAARLLLDNRSVQGVINGVFDPRHVSDHEPIPSQSFDEAQEVWGKAASFVGQVERFLKETA